MATGSNNPSSSKMDKVSSSKPRSSKSGSGKRPESSSSSSKRKSKKDRHRSSKSKAKKTDPPTDTKTDATASALVNSTRTKESKLLSKTAKTKSTQDAKNKNGSTSSSRKKSSSSGKPEASSLDAGKSEHTEATTIMEVTDHSSSHNDSDHHNVVYHQTVKELTARFESGTSKNGTYTSLEKHLRLEASKTKYRKQKEAKDKRRKGRDNALNAILRAKVDVLTKEKENIASDFEALVHENESLQSELSTVVDRSNGLAVRVDELTTLAKAQADALVAKERTISAQRELIKSLEKDNIIELLQWKKALDKKKHSRYDLRLKLEQLRQRRIAENKLRTEVAQLQ